MLTTKNKFLILILLILVYFYTKEGGFSNPLPSNDFNILIVEETDDRPYLLINHPEVLGVLSSSKIEEFKEKNNAHKHVWDKDIDISNIDEQWYKDAMVYLQKELDQAKDTKEILPKLIISHGRKYYEGKVQDEDKTLDLLESYK